MRSDAGVVDALRHTAWLLVLALLCVVFAGAVYWFDLFSSRWFVLSVYVVIFGLPFVAAYSYLTADYYLRQSAVPVAVVDPEHERFRLLKVDPAVWSRREIDESLATRQGNDGTVYVAESFEFESAERVAPDGSEESYRRPVLSGTWEAAVSSLEFIEDRAVLDAQRERLVPKVRESIDRLGSADAKVVERTDDVALALIEGAERDMFMSDLDGDAFAESGVDLDDERAVESDADAAADLSLLSDARDPSVADRGDADE